MKQQFPHNTELAASRQSKIEECLLQNMLQQPYERISVADMCRQMGISRRLYYTYFADKDACLISLIDRIIAESMDSMPFFAPVTSDFTQETVSYLCFWKDHAEFLDLIVKQNLKGLVLDRSFSYFKKHDKFLLPHLNTTKDDETTLWFYVVARFVILLQWYERNFDPPAEEMAGKYLRMLTNPIIQRTKIDEKEQCYT